MAGPVVTPVSADNVYLPRSQWLFMPEGSDREYNMGSFTDFTGTSENTEIEFYSKEYPIATLARTDLVRKNVTISATIEQLTPIGRAMMFMADKLDSYLVQ